MRPAGMRGKRFRAPPARRDRARRAGTPGSGPTGAGRRRTPDVGLVESRCYQERPPRCGYRPSPAGRDLLPVVRAMAAWAARHVAGVRIPAQVRAGDGDAPGT